MALFQVGDIVKETRGSDVHYGRVISTDHDSEQFPLLVEFLAGYTSGYGAEGQYWGDGQKGPFEYDIQGVAVGEYEELGHPLTDFEVGDEVWCPEFGYGTVTDVDGGQCYPYSVHFESTDKTEYYTEFGRWSYISSRAYPNRCIVLSRRSRHILSGKRPERTLDRPLSKHDIPTKWPITYKEFIMTANGPKTTDTSGRYDRIACDVTDQVYHYPTLGFTIPIGNVVAIYKREGSKGIRLETREGEFYWVPTDVPHYVTWKGGVE